jgi:hypothetical protein
MTMAEDEVRPRSEGIRIEQHSSVGLFWVAAWLFTIGFLHLSFWQAALALLLWPYYLGTALSPVLRP